MTESIIDGNAGIGVDSVCYFCKTNRNLERHHIFGGANRNKSEQYGLTVILCHNHHNEPQDGVHFNAANDKMLKSMAQSLLMLRNGWRVEDFQKVFGKMY